MAWFFVIGAVIILISALHFLTPIDRITLHEVYQRLYYLPIVAAALLFGLRGGISAAALASLCYLPHIFFQWHHQTEYALNQYAEIVLFFFFALVAGTMSDNNRRSENRLTATNIELEKSYAELRRTFQQLLQAEKLSALGELSAGIVHEIRNPLTSIKGAVEIIESELSTNNPRREFAAIAKLEIERIEKLVQEFVNFARTPQLSKSSTDINQLVKAIIILIQQQTESQQIHIHEQLAKDLPLLEIDAEQIKQVLLNLAINALQATSYNGKITFRTLREENAVTIEIEDTGCGIAEMNVERIFDPFFTTKKKGLGLGLSIAQKITDKHNGKLSAENISQGAKIKLVLPL